MTGSPPKDGQKKTLRDLPPATLRRVREMLNDAVPATELDVGSMHDEKARNRHAFERGRRSVVELFDQAISMARADRTEKEDD